MTEHGNGNLAATRVIVVGNQKGGVGKTTVSLGLACAWAELGRKILLVDCDPQRSASEWLGDERPIGLLAHREQDDLAKVLERLRGKFDAVVVDLPPGTSQCVEQGILVADELVIPVQPSGLDILAAEKTVILSQRGAARVRFVLNRLQYGTLMSKAIRDALRPYELEVCTATLGMRVAHGAAVLAQQPVTQYEPAGKAATEMRALAAEVWG